MPSANCTKAPMVSVPFLSRPWGMVHRLPRYPPRGAWFELGTVFPGRRCPAGQPRWKGGPQQGAGRGLLLAAPGRPDLGARRGRDVHVWLSHTRMEIVQFNRGPPPEGEGVGLGGGWAIRPGHAAARVVGRAGRSARGRLYGKRAWPNRIDLTEPLTPRAHRAIIRVSGPDGPVPSQGESP